MKKSLILGLLGLTVSVATSFGQGSIILDNYNVGPIVTYGEAGVPLHGVLGDPSGTVGAGLDTGWTAGFYYVVGNAVGSVAADPSHTADPATLGGSLGLATGGNSTAAFAGPATGHTVGTALAGGVFSVPGTSVDGNDTITVMMIAYNGSSYANSTFRGHSTAFTMITSANTSISPNKMGSGLQTFGVFAVPEPSVFALAGLGGAFLMLIRRKK